MDKKVKSGKEILDDFFDNVSKIEGVDKEITQKLSDLYASGKLSDVNIKNELLQLRKKDDSKDK